MANNNINSNEPLIFNPLTNSPLYCWQSITSDSTGQYLVAGGYLAGEFSDVIFSTYYSINGGVQWTQSQLGGLQTNLNSQLLVSSSDGQTVFAGGSTIGQEITAIYISTDAGANFNQLSIVSGNIINQITCDSTGQYIFATEHSENFSCVYRSNNFGQTWEQTSIDISNNQTYEPISCDSTGKYILTCDTNGGVVYLSSDFGETWILQTTSGNNLGISYSVAMSPIQPGRNMYCSVINVGLYANLPFPCFKENTKILTSSGYRYIQDLRKGDLIKTLKHGFKPINIIGKRTINNLSSDERIKDQLYKCSVEQYPELFEDLIITGCHSILVGRFSDKKQRDKTIEVNGDTFVTDGKYRLPACADERSQIYKKKGEFIIYHFALEHDDEYMNYGIYANGLLVETCCKKYLTELSGMTVF